jgi:hypothetical protein
VCVCVYCGVCVFVRHMAIRMACLMLETAYPASTPATLMQARKSCMCMRVLLLLLHPPPPGHLCLADLPLVTSALLISLSSPLLHSSPSHRLCFAAAGRGPHRHGPRRRERVGRQVQGRAGQPAAAQRARRALHGQQRQGQQRLAGVRVCLQRGAGQGRAGVCLQAV